VADWGNQRVAEFSESGEFVRQFGAEGTGNGQFKRPDVIEVDSKGQVWVGDQNNERLQLFNEAGEYITQFGTAGSGAGQFSFGWPMGISSDEKGNLWISDTGNNRVQKWSYGP
jgi:sugar lactone lactonase YvrE